VELFFIELNNNLKLKEKQASDVLVTDY